ncbi:MAG: hypothetical protein H6536_07960 [Bacteroidales bacterium]|nr:hypothetical protein [Bacteroidales bacterium]
MIRFVAVLCLLLWVDFVSFAQAPLGQWRDHFSFNSSTSVCVGKGKIYCGAQPGVFTYSLADGQVDKLTKVNGLSDYGVSAVAYFDEGSFLAVGYDNGNIDLVYSDRVVNIADVKNKALSASKRISDFYQYDGLLYASTGFGIVVINPLKEEIKDTYFIGPGSSYLKVNNLIVFNGKFWAATEIGLFTASVTDPFLVNYEHWVLQTDISNPSWECIGVTASDAVLFTLQRNDTGNDGLWRYNGTTWTGIDGPYASATAVKMNSSKVLLTSNSGITAYSVTGVQGVSVTAYSGTSDFFPNMAIPVDEDRIAVADGRAGLVLGTSSRQICIKPMGPGSNSVFSLATSRSRVVVAAGAYDASYVNTWTNFSVHSLVNERWGTYITGDCHDAVVAEFNPKDPSSYFVGSWGGGVSQYQDDQFLARYTPENSSLQTILPNLPYCRISGLAFDGNGNLWVANSQVEKPISVRKPDGTWIAFPYSAVINSEKLSTLHYSSANGTLWLILPRGEGMFVLHPGANIDSKDDDKYLKTKPYSSEGAVFGLDINDLAFDTDNALWIGTSQGVLMSYNPDKIFEGGFYVQKVKVPDVVEGLAIYLLETESITAVTVDGGNRKWFGTLNSGVFLYNADGTSQLLHFTTDNSPLPSNSILDVKIHPTTGEVFIVTEKGLVSYRGDATDPSDRFGTIYSYPNPVPPGYSGKISIVGLVKNTVVKITDISGNLVYETKSEGGMATWDGRSLRGHRVGTGVYLVFCADIKGEQSAVTKILFIK